MSDPSGTISDISPLAVTAPEYARVDEEWLRNGRTGVRVAVLSEPCLSLGVSQSTDTPSARVARERALSVHRRTSGGLAVYHSPGDLAWSLILPRADPRVGRDFNRAFGRLGSPAVRFLAALGVASSWKAPRGLATDCCLLAGAGDVLQVGDRALGGAAQHLSGGFLLHHGVLNFHLEVGITGALFGLPVETVRGALTGLDEVVPGRTPEALGRELQATLEAEFGREAR